MAKTHAEKVVAKVGKRPQSATQIGQKLGYPDHRGVAKALAAGVASGAIVKTPKGYQKS